VSCKACFCDSVKNIEFLIKSVCLLALSLKRIFSPIDADSFRAFICVVRAILFINSSAAFFSASLVVLCPWVIPEFISLNLFAAVALFSSISRRRSAFCSSSFCFWAYL
jgi:hypothetical protein